MAAMTWKRSRTGSDLPKLAIVAATAVAMTWLVTRGPSLPAASAQLPALAGGGGVYLMPGQLATNAWGVYVLDTDAGSLLAYRYDAGGNRLMLLAARDISADRGLKDFNTVPPPAEIRRQLDLERATRRSGRDDEADDAVAP